MSAGVKVEEEENVAENKFPEVFSQARAVTNGEASLILERHLNHKREEDATYQPTSMLQKTLEYCQRFASVRNTSAHDDIRRGLANQYLSEFEVAAMANLVPESPEEAKLLIPSLEINDRYSDEQLQTMLDDISAYKAT